MPEHFQLQFLMTLQQQRNIYLNITQVTIIYQIPCFHSHTLPTQEVGVAWE